MGEPHETRQGTEATAHATHPENKMKFTQEEEAMILADYEAEQESYRRQATIWVGPECPSFTTYDDTEPAESAAMLRYEREAEGRCYRMMEGDTMAQAYR